MTLQKSLLYRVGVGKALGLIVGLSGFYLLPEFLSEPSMSLRFGVLFWYVTFGAIIGVFGVFSDHPVLRLPLPWWIRGVFLGAWLNFVLTLIAYEQICTMVAAFFGEYSAYASPYWMVLEGAIIGLLMDYVLTHWFGEGFQSK